MHGSEGSAWARNLGVPLSDLRPLCVSVAGGESRKTFTQFSKREKREKNRKLKSDVTAGLGSAANILSRNEIKRGFLAEV